MIKRQKMDDLLSEKRKNLATYLKADRVQQKKMRDEAPDLTSHVDPYLVIEWHFANIAHAQNGGPHVDNNGHADPRNVAHLENHIINQGGERLQTGLFSFGQGSDITDALASLQTRFPWLAAGHPSHPAVVGAVDFNQGSHHGDVVVAVGMIRAPRKNQLEHMRLWNFRTFV
jgi:hypothetical protein